MKGICGFWHLDGAPVRVDDATNMAGALILCPPGDRRTWHEGSIAFGAAAWSRQPRVDAAPSLFRHAASGCVVVADARLDGPLSLMQRLELSGADALHATDARLILHAWLRWGEDCLEHLRGDFAFALHDPRRGQLFCARDGMGLRPLHVHHAPDRFFAFGSSVAAVLAHPRVPRTLDEGRIADHLVEDLEGIDKTSTFYSEVRKLAPAHCLVVETDRMRQRRYWQLHPDPPAGLPQDDDAWAQALTDVLERAVSHHLQAGRKVGCMLSGGMDSSTLAVMARDQLQARGAGPLPTFSSIDSTLAGCRETQSVKSMLEMPGFAPTVLDRTATAELLPDLAHDLWNATEPFDVSLVLVRAQYEAASRRGLDAVLDGVDGDSLLLEGNALMRQLRSGHWRAAWHNAHGIDLIEHDHPRGQTLARALRSAATPHWVRLRVRAWHRGRAVERNIQATLIDRDFARRIDLGDRLARLAAWRPPLKHSDATGEAIGALDHTSPIVGLDRYQRLAALNGVEPCHPFLDRDVLELGIHLPDRQRLRDGWTKPVLRHAMRQRLPADVCWRRTKDHLGGALARTLVQPDALLEHLAAGRPHLAGYVDLARLDEAVRRLDLPCDHPQNQTDAELQVFLDVFNAAMLGTWLANAR